MSSEAQAAATAGPSAEEAQQEIVDEFAMFDDWADRYRYIIDLGRDLDQLDEAERSDERIIRGCQSRVWLMDAREGGVLTFRAATDAAIVAGLNALGIGPRDMIDILSAIKTAGALHAEFIVH